MADNWITLFKRAGFDDETILNPSYLVSLFEGRKYCKACDSYFQEPTEDHIKMHKEELAVYNKSRKEETEKRKTEAREKLKKEKSELTPITSSEFYPTPCSVCGEGIPRSGARGRPPTKHAKCK